MVIDVKDSDVAFTAQRSMAAGSGHFAREASPVLNSIGMRPYYEPLTIVKAGSIMCLDYRTFSAELVFLMIYKDFSYF